MCGMIDFRGKSTIINKKGDEMKTVSSVKHAQQAKRQIAVIGMSCRFPSARNKDEYWSNLVRGVNSIQEVPSDRWNISDVYSTDIDVPNKTVSKWCGVVDDIFDFDNSFFNISPREARNMDPQQRLLLEEAWRCIEDSGIPLHELQQKKTGVYVGIMTTDYRHETFQRSEGIEPYACLGNYEAIAANRLSYAFDLNGPSHTINVACASSLVAIHEAKRSLLSGDCDYAIVGGVNANLHPAKYIAFSQSRMLSPNGQCKTFDLDANGYVPGDGVGVILLQRFDRAIQCGSHIYGVIKGSSVNHGGTALSITAPQVRAQREVIESALREANVDPSTVTYMEAHGTGTSLGDPIEMEALTQAFRSWTDKKEFCGIASVKTNIGHLEAAAGIAGIIKILMMMQHRQIPPHINLKTINPLIRMSGSPFFIPERTIDWTAGGASLPLRAGISSFGFGGVNSHIIVEAYEERKRKSNSKEWSGLFTLSAKSKQSLEGLIAKWKAFVQTDSFNLLHVRDICLTLLGGRSSLPFRCGVQVRSCSDIEAYLSSPVIVEASSQHNPIGLYAGTVTIQGYSEFDLFAELCPSAKEKVMTVLAEAEEVLGQSRIKTGFLQKKWPVKHLKLYQFAVGYVLASTLDELGCTISVSAGEREGVWVALALSGIVSLTDVVSMLYGIKAVGGIQLKRPKLPFYDHEAKKLRKPFTIDEEYMKLLMNLEYPDSATLQYYAQQAAMLLDKQFTFKKVWREWGQVIEDAVGLDITAILHDYIRTGAEERDTTNDSLLFVVLLDCFRHLNRKWDLTERESIRQSSYSEITELLADGIFDKQQVVYLICAPESKEKELLNALLRAKVETLTTGNFNLLKNCGNPFLDIANSHEWLTKLTGVQQSFDLEGHDMILLGSSEFLPSGSFRHTLQTVDLQQDFTDLLLTLWLEGKSIDWRMIAEEGQYDKLPLPTTVYERTRFRIDESAAGSRSQISNGSESMNALNTDKSFRQVRNSNDEEYNMGMSDKTVSLQKVDTHIALIVMQDKLHRNMFSEELLTGLAEAFDAVREDKGIKVVILTGYENVFSMGGTQGQLTDIANRVNEFTKLSVVYKSALSCPVPVISAIQGHAIGGGLTLGLYGDLIIMANEGVYTANYVNYGFTPGLGSTYILREKLGTVLATEMMLTAGEYRGEELKQRGCPIIFKDQREVLPEAVRLARTIASKPMQAVRTLKEELAGRSLTELLPIIDREVKMHGVVFSHPEVQDVKDRIQYYFSKSDNHRAESLPNHSASSDSSKPIGIPQELLREEREHVARTVISTICRTLHLPADEVTPEDTLKELGVDSIASVEIIRDINKAFNIRLEAVTIYDHPLVGSLINYVERECHKELASIQPHNRLESERRGNAGKEELLEEGVRPKIQLRSPSKNNAASCSPILNSTQKGCIGTDENSDGLNEIKNNLVHLLSRILMMPSSNIRMDQDLRSMGVDSIGGVEFIRDINIHYELNLETVSIYDFTTINELAALIVSQLRIGVNNGKKQFLREQEPARVASPTQFESSPVKPEEAMYLLRQLSKGHIDVDEILKLTGD
ncbi:hypothetical protein BBG47_04985 [Paenibacillus sp. KS1]|nr:hypothetical protein BBG47_04985 [Paenibacillus sp. KS1]